MPSDLPEPERVIAAGHRHYGLVIGLAPHRATRVSIGGHVARLRTRGRLFLAALPNGASVLEAGELRDSSGVKVGFPAVSAQPCV